MTKTREWLPKILVESFLIAFSILLALGVDDWKEERQNEQLVREAIVNFEREIRLNKAHLENRLPYHERLWQSLISVNPREVRTIEELRQRTDFQGLRVVFLVDTAWQTALTTNALTHMDYETVSRLTAIYALQKRIYDYNALIGSVFLQLLSDENIQALSLSLQASQNDVVLSEKQLLREYDAALQHLKTLSTGYIPKTSDSRSAPR